MLLGGYCCGSTLTVGVYCDCCGDCETVTLVLELVVVLLLLGGVYCGCEVTYCG